MRRHLEPSKSRMAWSLDLKVLNGIRGHQRRYPRGLDATTVRSVVGGEKNRRKYLFSLPLTWGERFMDLWEDLWTLLKSGVCHFHSHSLASVWTYLMAQDAGKWSSVCLERRGHYRYWWLAAASAAEGSRVTPSFLTRTPGGLWLGSYVGRLLFCW